MNDTTKITIVVNNVSSDTELTAEHGYSLYIQAGGLKIVFDAGQDRTIFETNARKLGIDLKRADALVLSHGHYDHSGGVPVVLETADAVELYAHPSVLNSRYSVRPERVKSNGMPQEACEAIRRLAACRLHWTCEPCMLADDVGVTGYIPRVSGFEDTGGPFFIDAAGNMPDPINDDQALWIKTAGGLVVCAGCSHAGIVNTLAAIRRISGCEKIRAVIGGFHLVNASEERIEKTIAALDDFDPALIVPCHCTGAAATERILAHFGGRAVAGAAGLSFCFSRCSINFCHKKQEIQSQACISR